MRFNVFSNPNYSGIPIFPAAPAFGNEAVPVRGGSCDQGRRNRDLTPLPSRTNIPAWTNTAPVLIENLLFPFSAASFSGSRASPGPQHVHIYTLSEVNAGKGGDNGAPDHPAPGEHWGTSWVQQRCCCEASPTPSSSKSYIFQVHINYFCFQLDKFE